MQPPVRERIAERGDDVLLTRQLGKRLGPPLAGEDLVGHREFSEARAGRAATLQHAAATLHNQWVAVRGGEPFPRHLR